MKLKSANVISNQTLMPIALVILLLGAIASAFLYVGSINEKIIKQSEVSTDLKVEITSIKSQIRTLESDLQKKIEEFGKSLNEMNILIVKIAEKNNIETSKKAATNTSIYYPL